MVRCSHKCQHSLPDRAVWWHYMLEMAFYWSLFFTQFSDVKRKDFTEMFIHHLATLALLTLSWTTQMFREDERHLSDKAKTLRRH